MRVYTQLFAISAVFLFSCNSPSLDTVADVEINKYMGTWYEIASFPTTFQKGCSCSKAEYQLSADKSYVEVINSCIKKGKQGAILGKAFPVEGSHNTKLKVQFFWPFKADYYIIALADDYSYAMVGHPNRDYLWILCRTKQMDQALYDSLLLKAKALGFDTSLLKRTTQDCE